MREIKFRAWDGKEMFKVSEIKYINGKTIKKVIATDAWYGDDCYAHGEKYSEILMQYTGLKDKNGKEIYEGDICFKKGYGKNCVIRWNKEWLKYEAFYGISDNGGDLTIGLGYWKQHLCHICDNCGNKTEKKEITEHIFGNTLEIIGNIYENPNLLINN